jgi:prepilin-type processing-associated H-X9-DG protein
MADSQMRKDTWSTNFGWAVKSLKQNKGQTELFTCPTDPRPLPAAAVLDRIYDGANFIGTTTGDAVYTRIKHNKSSGEWTTDIQDQCDNTPRPGNDAYDDSAGDLLIKYTPPAEKAHFTAATLGKGAASWRHDVLTYKEEMIAQNISGQVQATIPLLWMSYGANASAGLKGTGGNPLLITETGKLGIFPEHFQGPNSIIDKNYPRDHLGWVMHFNHGNMAPAKDREWLRALDWTQGSLGSVPPRTGVAVSPSWYDGNYSSRSRVNAGFMDGHVERAGYWELMRFQQGRRPIPIHSVWFGNRKTNSVNLSP